MAYVITQRCVGVCDTACVEVCPCDCIIGPEEGQMVIDPDDCIDCGACMQECPVSAIVLDDDAEAADVERNRVIAARIRSR
jgi:ferredoxin